MKTRISVLSGLTRSTPILAALLLAGLTLQTGAAAAPILVGKSQLARNQSTLPLETARALVAHYNASHGAGVPDLPMPDSVTKAGRYGFSKQARTGKNVMPGSSYFLVKGNRTEQNRNGVQLFYSADAQDGAGGAAGSAGGSVGGSSASGGQSGMGGNNGGADLNQANPINGNSDFSGYSNGNGNGNANANGNGVRNGNGNGDTAFGFTPHGSGQHPSQVPDSGGTLALLGLAIGALGFVRSKFHL